MTDAHKTLIKLTLAMNECISYSDSYQQIVLYGGLNYERFQRVV